MEQEYYLGWCWYVEPTELDVGAFVVTKRGTFPVGAGVVEWCKLCANPAKYMWKTERGAQAAVDDASVWRWPYRMQSIFVRAFSDCGLVEAHRPPPALIVEILELKIRAVHDRLSSVESELD